MQNVFVIFACISMAITSVAITGFLILWADEVFLARRYYRALRAEIREAVENIDEIYGNEKIRTGAVLDYLKYLHDRRWINWSQVRIDKKEREQENAGA